MGQFFIFFISILFVSSCSIKDESREEDFSEFLEKNDRETCNDNPQIPLNPKVIYGNDNRLDLYELCDYQHLEMAKSTLALINSNQISGFGNDLKIKTSHFGNSYNLCPDEPFYHQEVVSFCSGFLVTPNIIITAGHCMLSQRSCDKTKFVFGYGIHTPNHNPAIVKSDDVYSCQQIIHSEIENSNDYAVIQLDRNVVGRNPLKIRRSGTITVGSPLVVIGHPSGLPTKVADSARVRSLSEFYFTSNLDTYGGNSGSAVFNNISGDVEGILVRGEIDYMFDSQRQCRLSFRCSNNSCAGEEITKITEVLRHIPEP